MATWQDSGASSSKGSNQSFGGDSPNKSGGSGKHSKKGGDQSRKGQRRLDKKNIKCYACGKRGHFIDECYNNKGKHVKDDEAQMAYDESDDSDSDNVLLVVTTSETVKYDCCILILSVPII